jgi:hypothetical protein
MLHHNFSISEGCKNHLLEESILHISYFGVRIASRGHSFLFCVASIDRQKTRNLITEIRTVVVNTCNEKGTKRGLRHSQQECDRKCIQHAYIKKKRRYKVLAWKRKKVQLEDIILQRIRTFRSSMLRGYELAWHVVHFTPM